MTTPKNVQRLAEFTQQLLLFPLLLGVYFAPAILSAQVCPTIGLLDANEPTVCEGYPFSLLASGITDATMATNGVQDYDINLVYLPSGSTDDPYTDGTVIDTETPDAAGNAEFLDVDNLLPVGAYDFYVILSPTPTDPTCRPSAVLPFTVTPCNRLGDFTFLDFDNNGNFDGQDIPLPLVTVTLFDATTDLPDWDFGPETTDGLGNYVFNDVPPGDYFVRYAPPAGYVASTAVTNPVDNQNNIDPAAGNGDLSTADFAYPATADNFAVDAGFTGTGSVSLRVWGDDDFDGTANEAGQTGVVFDLSWEGLDQSWGTADDVTFTATSGTNGLLSYPNLPFGNYRLTVNSVAGTPLANGYERVAPSTLPYEFTIDATNLNEAEVAFRYEPACLPSTGRLLTNASLVMCGNAAEGIYAGQAIPVNLTDFVLPASIPGAYQYYVLVVNDAGDLIQVHPVTNPLSPLVATVDLVGLPIGSDYTIHGLHVLTTDPDIIATPLDLTVGQPVQPILDRLTQIDGQPNAAATADVCGDISLTQNILTATREPQPPITLGCLGQVNVSLNNACAATVTPEMVLTGNWGCLRPQDVQISIDQNGQAISNDGTLSGCGTYEYMATSLLPNTPGFPCWGYINARDVSAPVIACPADVSMATNALGTADFYCTDVDQLLLTQPTDYVIDGAGNLVQIAPNLQAILNVTGYPTILDGCDNVLVTVSDELVENGDCGTLSILRSFVAEDKFGSVCTGTPNSSVVCTQTITFTRPTLADVVLPPSVVELDCSDFSGELNPTPIQISDALDVLSHPAIFAFFDADPSTVEFDPELLNQVYCNLNASYSDLPRVNSCGQTYSFIREWYIFDKCDLSSNIEFSQLVKIKDNTDPSLLLPTVDYDNDGFADVRRYSTSSAFCEAFIAVPTPVEVSDFCSAPVDVVVTITDANGTFLYQRTIGQTFTVPPGNYNLAYCATDVCGNETCVDMPIIVRDEIEPTVICDDNIIAQIGGGDILNGISGVGLLFVEDIDEGSNDNCSAVTLEARRNFWQNNDCGISSSQYAPWDDEIYFYCCDVGRPVTVELRVTDAVGNSNTCSFVVTPEDKLKPSCFAPANQTIDCVTLPTLFPGDIAQAYLDDFSSASSLMTAIFGGPTGTDNCAVDTLVERSPNVNINECGWGTISRRFEVWQWDANGDANNNNQIDVTEVLRSTSSCNQLITVTETHDYTIEFPADATADCADPDIPSLQTSTAGCDNLVINISEPVRFLALGDECYKLRIVYDVINWCQWDGEATGYVIARQTDTDDTVVDECERPIVRANDNGAVIDRNHAVSGCSSGLGVTNVPPAQNVARWRYTQFVKVYDTTLPTFTLAAYGGATTVCPELNPGEFGATDNANCTGTVAISFALSDDCEEFDDNGQSVLQLLSADLDLFANDTSSDGLIDANEFQSEQDVLSSVSSNADGTFVYQGEAPIIAPSDNNTYHALRLLIEDGCGNQNVQFVSFRVLDCKGTAPICINGLTANLTLTSDETCEGTLWATDFLGSPVTDCSGPLQYAIYRTSEVLAAGDSFVPSPADSSIVFTMDDSETTSLHVYAIDAAGNFDYCETYALVQPSFACIATGAIGGMVMTEAEQPVWGVQMSLSGPTPQAMNTGNDGAYFFDDLEEDYDYTVTAYRNDNPHNGVTTF
ncbi:MAG: SdrD B-like domain-containing protein, partial [Bacteroidota bacterium]